MYTILWKPLAEQQAGRLWFDNPPDRDRLLALFSAIAGQLKIEPYTCG